jgi:hypothetical protein
VIIKSIFKNPPGFLRGDFFVLFILTILDCKVIILHHFSLFFAKKKC